VSQQCQQAYSKVSQILSLTGVARLWPPRVSPRRKHKFHKGEVFRGEKTSVTPLVAAAASASRPQLATDEQKNEQTNKQTVGYRRCVKPPSFAAVLNNQNLSTRTFYYGFYKFLVRPHLEYCTVASSPQCTKKQDSNCKNSFK